MKRLALAAVAVVFVLAGTLTATAAQTPTTKKSTEASKPAATCLLPAFRGFSARVWAVKQWERGLPPASTITASQKRIGCAPPAHARAMKATWSRDRARFLKYRRTMQSTRCGTPACNIQLGWLIASHRGISRSEFDGCLVPLWDRESTWDEQAWNSESGAGGIPQGLPASKMGADADPSTGGWKVAAAQINWGLNYLAERYGGPCGGWEHSNANGWY